MEELIAVEMVRLIMGGIIFVVPLWIIFKKAGLSPWGSLFIFIPPFGVGVLVVALILGYRKWPSVKGK